MLILIYCGHTENDPYYAALPYSNNTLIVARTNFWYDNHSRCYLLQKTYDTPSALIAAKLRRLPWDDLCESMEYLIEICLVLLQFHAVWKWGEIVAVHSKKYAHFSLFFLPHEQAIEEAVDVPVIWGIMTPMRRHWNC